MPEMYLGTKRVMATLRKTGEIREYAGVVELQERGAPHLHLLVTGEFIHYRRLSRLARGRPGSRGRFGKVAWIERVEPGQGGEVNLAGYFTKELAAVGGELAGYVTKARAEQLRVMGAKGQRVRPIRRSNGWYPGGMAAARAALIDRWHPGAERRDVDAWILYRLERDTGEMRYVKALGAGSPASVLHLPSESALAA